MKIKRRFDMKFQIEIWRIARSVWLIDLFGQVEIGRDFLLPLVLSSANQV
ncbi:hypothetical protein ACFL2C_03250 [Patescibacteria group bacterium]